MNEMHVWIFLPEFVKALEAQLKDDENRWGVTFLNRTREGQEERIIDTFYGYFDDYEIDNKPMPWLKVAGNALIAWARENHPEIWPK